MTVPIPPLPMLAGPVAVIEPFREARALLGPPTVTRLCSIDESMVEVRRTIKPAVASPRISALIETIATALKLYRRYHKVSRTPITVYG